MQFVLLDLSGDDALEDVGQPGQRIEEMGAPPIPTSQSVRLVGQSMSLWRCRRSSHDARVVFEYAEWQ
jgi:hypothetical protein